MYVGYTQINWACFDSKYYIDEYTLFIEMHIQKCIL